MLESQTVIRRNSIVSISRVVILLIVVLGIQFFLRIGFFRQHLIILFQVASDHHMPDMTVDVMQSATFDLNISDALHSAQTNPAMANEPKRACKFSNGNSSPGLVMTLMLSLPPLRQRGFLLLDMWFCRACLDLKIGTAESLYSVH